MKPPQSWNTFRTAAEARHAHDQWRLFPVVYTLVHAMPDDHKGISLEAVPRYKPDGRWSRCIAYVHPETNEHGLAIVHHDSDDAGTVLRVDLVNLATRVQP